MMNSCVSNRFEIQGRFAGFVRDLFGKRRMTLRRAEGDIYLKIPKALRKGLEGRLVIGQEVTVCGEEPVDGRKRVVSKVRIAGSDCCVGCPIRVCTKKNCWRNGGKELWETLERKIAEGGLEGTIQLEGVDCLDHCKHGPNAECGGREYHHCRPHDADEILREGVE